MTELLHVDPLPDPYRLKVEDYLALDELGTFGDARTELIDGQIYFMNSQYLPHVRLKMDLYDALRDALRTMESGLRPLVEGSISVPPHNAPEPDILLARTTEGAGLIPVNSVALIVEVASTTLRSDLTIKAQIYARHGIPEYWVADVNGAVLHQHWSPADGRYTGQRVVAAGATIAAATIPGLSLVVPSA